MSPDRQLGLIWGGVALILLLALPLAPAFESRVPACPIKSHLDVPCLTCGGTRATVALAGLDAWEALSWNPLVALGLAGLVGGGLAVGGLALVDRAIALPVGGTMSRVRWLAITAVLANWFYLVLADI